MSVQISAISIAISLVLGTFLGVAMSSKNKFIFFVLKICLEIVRIMPQIVWLFLFYYGASKAFGLDISKFNASLIVFSLWGVFESAAALALSKTQIYLYVVIPLATRRLVPAGVNLLSRIIKTTPIVALIGVPDLLKVGQQTIETASLTANPTVPFWIYGFIFLLYFLVCYPISKLSKILENRWA